MKIVVIGAGAMGMLFGGKIARNTEHDVTLVDVNPQTIEAIRTHGLLYDDGEQETSIAVKACLSEDVKEQADLVILFTKTIYSESALASARHFIGPNTWVLTLQNGLGNIELIRQFVAPDKILAGVTNYPSDVKGPGKFSSVGSGYVKIMTADLEEHEMLQDVFSILKQAGFQVEIAKDIYQAIWEKVAFNAAINGISAVCKVPCGGVGITPEGRMLAEHIVRETALVALAEHVQMDAQAVLKSLENTYDVHKNHFTSMTQDILSKRKTEADFINGGIVKKAKLHGLSVPYTEAVYCMLKIHEHNYSATQN